MNMGVDGCRVREDVTTEPSAQKIMGGQSSKCKTRKELHPPFIIYWQGNCTT